jgi:hypothetical protein
MNNDFKQPEKRRKKILDILQKNNAVLSGSEIARIMGVTRQIIIKDIALLRAKGYDIIATPDGYTMKRQDGIRAVFAVKHTYKDIEKELTIIVQNGGRILDVVVEHPLYGELKGNLNIKTLEDVKRFIAKMKTSHAKPLLDLSEGVHLHTIEADSNEIIQKIKNQLEESHILLH